MLQRALASVFLLIILLAQALPGVCRLRCDHQMAAAAMPSCHTMSMAANQPLSQASSPCNTQPCSSDTLLLAQRSDSPDLSSRPVELPSALQSDLPALSSPTVWSHLEPHRLRPPAAPVPLLKTALRV